MEESTAKRLKMLALGGLVSLLAASGVETAVYNREFNRRLEEFRNVSEQKNLFIREGSPAPYNSNLPTQRRYYWLLRRTESEFDENLEAFLGFVDENKGNIAAMVGWCETGGIINRVNGDFELVNLTPWQEIACSYLEEILNHDFANFSDFERILYENFDHFPSLEYDTSDSYLDVLENFRRRASLMDALGRVPIIHRNTFEKEVYREKDKISSDYADSRELLIDMLIQLTTSNVGTYENQIKYRETLFASYHVHPKEVIENTRSQERDAANSIIGIPRIVIRNVANRTLIIDAYIRGKHREIYRVLLQ